MAKYYVEAEMAQEQSDEIVRQGMADISLKNKVEWEHQDMEEYIYGDDDSAAKVKVRGNAADAKAEAKISVYDDGEIDPEVRVGAEAKYSGIKIEGEGEIGNKYLGGGLEGKGGLMNADAEAALKVGEDEADGKWNACVKGKALASVLEGSVEGKVKICGIEIGVEGTGYAGGIGAEFKGGVENGKFRLKAGAAAVLGGGVSISIGFAD